MTDRPHFSAISRFAYGDQVFIDRDESIKATVTAFCFRQNYVTLELSWMANGDNKVAYFEEWRLTLVT